MLNYLYNFCGGGLYMMLIPLLLIAVIVYAVFKLNEPGSGVVRNGRDDAFRILDERFARGEINEAEYQQKKSLLQKK